MTIIPFARSRPGQFDGREMSVIAEIAAPATAAGLVGSVEWGSTERGEPQAYFLAAGPEPECLLCISRVGRIYVIEDGNGGIVAEVSTLRRVGEQARRAFTAGKSGLTARIAVAWVAAREFFEEKVEPAMAKSLEVATHFAPQLATLV